jgi:hypothetical protein
VYYKDQATIPDAVFPSNFSQVLPIVSRARTRVNETFVSTLATNGKYPLSPLYVVWAGIAQSEQRLALQVGLSGDRIPARVRFSAPVQPGSGAHPASYTMGTGSFPGVKRPGRGVDHQPHLASRLKKE